MSVEAKLAIAVTRLYVVPHYGHHELHQGKLNVYIIMVMHLNYVNKMLLTI